MYRAREAQVEHIVLLSQWTSGARHPSFATRQTSLTDQLFRNIPGVTCTVLNPGYFAFLDNYLRVLPTAAQLGILPILQGELESRNAPPSNEDIARIAALLDPFRHAGKTYRPTGPDLLSGREMVAVIEKVLCTAK